MHGLAAYTPLAVNLTPNCRRLLDKLKYTHPHTYEHSLRVAELTAEVAVADAKTAVEIQEAYIAALLHDIGKMIVPSSILHANRALTPDEREQVDVHAIYGANLVQELPEHMRGAILLHHTPYTYTKHNYIASVIHVCDVFDALRSARSYKPALRLDECLRILTDSHEGEYYPGAVKYLQNKYQIRRFN